MSWYINETPSSGGAYSPPLEHLFEGCIPMTDDQAEMVVQYNGFVIIRKEEDDAGAFHYEVEPNLEAWEEWKEWKESLPDPEPEPEDSPFIPAPEQSAILMARAVFANQVATMEVDEILQCSGMADDWAAGKHTKGEVYNTRNGVHADGPEWDQTWECFQDYDNGTFPDIAPGNPAWFTFNRPLHGKSVETARPFVPVQGSHDMYRTGEYAVWTDGKTYRCKNDTNFSPGDYPDFWEVAA